MENRKQTFSRAWKLKKRPIVIIMSPSSECRVCLSSEGELISPCACIGSVQYIHISCLEQWQSKRVNSDRCELCKAVLSYKIRHWQTTVNLAELLWFIVIDVVLWSLVCASVHIPATVILQIFYSANSAYLFLVRKDIDSVSVITLISVLLYANTSLPEHLGIFGSVLIVSLILRTRTYKEPLIACQYVNKN